MKSVSSRKPGKSAIVAERALFVRTRAKNEWKPFRISFDRPTQQARGEWACTVSIEAPRDLDAPKRQVVRGVDGVQALRLAMRFADTVLMHSRAFAESRVAWEPNGQPLRLGDMPTPLPIGGVKQGAMATSEVVRTLELEIDWGLPCVLRIEVLRRRWGNEFQYYFTRVWRADSYRLVTTESASVPGRKRTEADETVLVEDFAFSDTGVAEETIEAAVEATLAKIRLKLLPGAPTPGARG